MSQSTFLRYCNIAGIPISSYNIVNFWIFKIKKEILLLLVVVFYLNRSPPHLLFYSFIFSILGLGVSCVLLCFLSWPPESQQIPNKEWTAEVRRSINTTHTPPLVHSFTPRGKRAATGTELVSVTSSLYYFTLEKSVQESLYYYY